MLKEVELNDLFIKHKIPFVMIGKVKGMNAYAVIPYPDYPHSQVVEICDIFGVPNRHIELENGIELNNGKEIIIPGCVIGVYDV